jgi:hypothetical protein
MRYDLDMVRARLLFVLALFAASFALSACDPCGYPIRSQGNSALTACKGDAPR